MSDNLKIFGINYPDTSGFKAKDTEGNTLTFTTGSGGSSATLGIKNITANGTYTATNDNYDGYSEVSVNVPTGTARTSADLITDGATVNVPAGLYAAATSKTIASGSAQTPTTTIIANPSISVNSSGLITASVSGSQNVTPTVSAGYISEGTAGTISVSGSTTSQLSTQAATTITPSTTSQTAVAAGK